MAGPRRPRLATVWLGGCSGCHMSLLDTDEWLFDLAARADIVYGPLSDVKTYPDDVDVCLVEGAVANTDNLEMAHRVRANTTTVVSFGDCAVTGNVTALRNPLGVPADVLRRVYVDSADGTGAIPGSDGMGPDGLDIVPALLPRVLPVHQVIDIDVFLTGCPPSADRIRQAIEALLDGAPLPDIRYG